MTELARRPVIGVTTQTLHAIHGIPEGLPESWVMNQRYFRAVMELGGVPWMIPLVPEDLGTLRAIYDHLDGLLLPGGVDMDPQTYGEEKTPLVGALDPARDATELQLTRWAMADGLPVLGLCRGAQVINVAAGGTLYQDLAEELPGAIKHDYFPFRGQSFARDYLAHDVEVAGGTRLASLLGAGPVRVNSMHHQGVKELGQGLVSTAVSPDGLVEALEGERDSYLVAVQWHPEALTDNDERTRRLFADFIQAASESRKGS